MGYHWELIGALGTTCHNDVLARMAGVHVRGGGPAVAVAKMVDGSASLRVPLKDFTLGLTSDLRGNLKIDPASNGERPPTLPALELLDDRGRIAAVLRLDLGPGDRRFDLARTKAVIRDRLAERADMELVAKKEINKLEARSKNCDWPKECPIPLTSTKKRQAKRKESSARITRRRC